MGTAQSPSLFVPLQNVITRLQVNPDLDGLQEVLQSAVIGAQLHAQTILDSILDITAQDNTYFLDEDAFSGIQPGGQFRLEIPSGFVRTDQPLTVMVGTNWQLTDGAVAPPSDYRMDYQRGILYVSSRSVSPYTVLGAPPSYKNSYVQVQCTTGYQPSSMAADGTYTPPEDIPDWLCEAIIAYVGIVLDISQTTNRQANAATMYKRAGDHATAILAPYIRRRGLLFRPIG